MRLFVAIDIPDAIRVALAQTCQQLKPAASGARWVRPEAMHFTLKFIGEQPEERVEAIQSALRKVRVPATVQIQVVNLWFFPDTRFPSVLAARIQTLPIVEYPENPLVKLVEKIEFHLEPLGIKREKRGFRAHLTVARLDPRAKHSALEAALESGPMHADFGTFDTSEFQLYRSQLQRGGAVYSKLATFPFAKIGSS